METTIEEVSLAALERGQVLRLRAVSESMLPWIHPGDVLLARRESLHVGDIALTRFDGRWVTHRVVGLGSGRLFIAGSAGGGRYVDFSDVLGRVIAIRRDVRSPYLRFRRRVSRSAAGRLWRKVRP